MTRRAPRLILFDFAGNLDSDGVPWKEHFYPLYREGESNVIVPKSKDCFTHRMIR
jgi:hypothetical protein